MSTSRFYCIYALFTKITRRGWCSGSSSKSTGLANMSSNPSGLKKKKI
jgi:hypothetical protein